MRAPVPLGAPPPGRAPFTSKRWELIGLNFVYPALGALLVLLALVDSLWTTLWVDGGAGPISTRLTTWLWRGLLTLPGHRHHRTVSLFGPVILICIVLLWVLLLWAGWVLVFASAPDSLLSTRDSSPANWTGRIYFVAYTIFTMGNGDFAPNGGVWQVVTAAVNASGMLLVTLAITYVLSVVSAVVQKRAFASQVTSLGSTPQELVELAWNGKNFRTIDLTLSSLSATLSTATELYLAYPILQYYHATRPSKSPVVALVTLDEALTLLRYGVPEEVQPNRVELHSLRASVAEFLATLPSAFVAPADEPPTSPNLEALREAGIPTVDQGKFRQAVGMESDRRRKLLGLVRNSGWNWMEWNA